MTKKQKRPGPVSLFPGKDRTKPVTLTLTPAHHEKVKANTERLGITRAELIALLIDKFSDSVTTEYASAYKRLRDAVAALGGNLEHHKRNQPRGGTWVLSLGGKQFQIPSAQLMSYPELDACYKLKDGVTMSRTWDDHTPEIEPGGVAELFRLLATKGSPRIV